MGRASIAIGGADCCPRVLDGPVTQQSLCDEKPTAGFCIGLGRGGQSLSSTSRAPISSRSDASQQGPQDEVVLDQLWFQLSADDRARFGDCFSRMVLKALGRQTRYEGASTP